MHPRGVVIVLIVLMSTHAANAVGGLGDACANDAACTTPTTGTKCQTTCKLLTSQDCTSNTDKCVTGAECGTDKKCACKTGYKVQTDKTCLAEPGTICATVADCDQTKAGVVCPASSLICSYAIGAACTSGDCDNIPGAYCDSATSKCKCGAIYAAGAADVVTCVGSDCTVATLSTTCGAQDSNSRCSSKKCDCTAGYDVYGVSSKCQSAGSPGVGLIASSYLLVVAIAITALNL